MPKRGKDSDKNPNATKEMVKDLKDKNVKLAAIDKNTANRIKKISGATGESATAIISAAMQVLEKSLGRQIIVRQKGSDWDLQINHFQKYNKITTLSEGE